MILRWRTVPNFFGFLWRQLVQLFRREPQLAPSLVAELRHRVCRECPSKQYAADTDQCRVCTCFCAMKTLYTTEKCPKGHW